MYLDKYSKKVLKYFITNDKPQSEFVIASNIKFNDVNDDDKLDTVSKSLENLIECNCIKAKYISLNYTEYSLTNYGRHFFKISKENTFYKYWYPLITASIAFVLNLIISLLMK